MKDEKRALMAALVLAPCVLLLSAMHPAFRPEPFKFKDFLIGLVLNLLTAAVLLGVLYRYPEHREYFYATFAGLLALGVAWAVVSYRRRKHKPGA